jgi:hypothetical protein
MRRLFRLVQHLDGFETTQPNADGVLPRLIAEVGFDAIAETSVVATPTGSISLYQAHRPRTAPNDATTTARAPASLERARHPSASGRRKVGEQANGPGDRDDT